MENLLSRHSLLFNQVFQLVLISREWQHDLMIRTPVASDRPIESPSLEGIAVQYVEQWLSQCEAFRQWYRQHFYLQTPGDADKRLADEIQPWMIRMTRALLAPMRDP